MLSVSLERRDISITIRQFCKQLERSAARVASEHFIERPSVGCLMPVLAFEEAAQQVSICGADQHAAQAADAQCIGLQLRQQTSGDVS